MTNTLGIASPTTLKIKASHDELIIVVFYQTVSNYKLISKCHILSLVYPLADHNYELQEIKFFVDF